MPFLFTNIPKFYQFETFFTKNITFFGKLTTNFIRKGSKLKKKLKTQGKNSKLKEKTQNSSKKLMVWEALAPYVSPSDVKKKCLPYSLLLF